MSSISLEFWLAWRYLKSKKKEKFISISSIFSFFGIMIGVATLIIVMSVMNGFHKELVTRIIGINSHLAIHANGKSISNYQDLINDLKNIKYISDINSIIENEVMIATNNKTSGALIKGISLIDLEKKPLIKNNIKRGKLENLNKENNIIIGVVLARKMQLNIGDKLKIIAPQSNVTIIGQIPRIKTYIVGGIFESELYQFDASTIFMNIKDTRIHFQYQKNATSSIEVFVTQSDIELIRSTGWQIKQILLKHNIKAYVQNWQDSNSSFIEALDIERTAMFLILTLIIIVAAFNIISSLIMLVKDKNKNIACLRTMGISKASIMRIFIICGSIIGFMGSFFGILFGFLFATNINQIKSWLESITDSQIFNPAIYFLSHLPSEVFIGDIILISIMSFSFSILATIYPSYKASKLSPAEILRYE